MKKCFVFLTLLLLGAALLAASFPDVKLKPLEEKKITSILDVEGDLIVLNFWATWCPPCRVELPILQKIAGDYGDRGVEVITISVDTSEKKVIKYLRKKKLHDLPVYFLMDKDYKALGVESLPVTHLLNGKGEILMTISGYDTEMEKTLRKHIEQHIKQ